MWLICFVIEDIITVECDLKIYYDKPEEEYIDLIPVLKNLYFDPDTFLAPIKEVSVVNG